MWQLNRRKGVPVYQEITELVLSAVKKGELMPGDRLPAERKLASQLGVNRSTVVHALEELEDMGWIVRKQGSGSFIAEGKWGVTSAARTDWKRYLEQNAFSKTEPFIEDMKQVLRQNDKQVIDGYTGELPLELIPSFDIPPLTWKQFLEEEQQDDFGYFPLRESISKMTEEEYGLLLEKETLLITSGAQQALFMILQVLLSAGDAVAIEDPSFLYALPVFQAAGIRLYGVPMDNEGIELSALEQTIRQHRVKMVMVNPSFQNPTGKVMGRARREQLVQLCQSYQIPIIEDDVFGQLRQIASEKIPPLKKLDPDNVLYIGSLSKILGSTTKIGWLSAPLSVNRQIAEARKIMDFSLSIFPQVLATIALNDTSFYQKLAELKKEVSARGEAVCSILEELGEWHVERPQGGFYVWATFSKGSLKQQEWQYFIKEALLIAPSFLFSEKKDSIRINFSRISKEQQPMFQEKMKKITQLLLKNREHDTTNR
ncbi:aminotransferase-like domain-containing protein [Enterococcus sp. BWR-S5]|uniref:aminotransferase-like domain-containing protein n=1 Tax=Enterococcus sp. BWR-S5 TaxID=2787714 RepID=UPI00192195FC|nr:PLP-dependent aminotransferase family protein [Enterococcus sp. BWR-S5]MBL1227439.1 PLP-dependent aminotransferase family protein [Enterococcus sp. BWR-S5]